MRREIKIDADGNIILKVPWRSFLKLAAILGLALAAGRLPLEGLTPDARTCLMIFVAAAGLWITEAVPPFATGILVIVLSVFLLGKPATPGIPGGASYQIFLNPFSSPVLVLFFGGLIMGQAAAKHGLDVRLAKAFIKPFGTHPKMVLLGVILTTGFFSMFMSNTATTAMMIAIVGPLFKQFEGRDHFKKALVLAVPFAANLGGMGTLIGTPPNAVAASVLASLGYPISFLKWMAIGVPVAFVCLLILWKMLFRVYRPREDHFEILFPEPIKLTWDLMIVMVTCAVTILLWLLEPLTHLPSAVVALLPVLVFPLFGILDRDDFQHLEWHVLILIGGGLALGAGMAHSGLSNVLVSYLAKVPVPPLFFMVILAMAAIVLSNFMSNTAAANILIPIMIPLAVFSPVMGALTITFACSLAMSLPISTPPNAIAFATHVVETRDIARNGTRMSVLGLGAVLAILFFAHLVLKVI